MDAKQATANAGWPTGNRPTVLIVDDDQRITDLYQAILRSEDYRVVAAGSADTALLWTDHITPDAALIDFRMPVIGGVQLLRTFRATPRLASVRVALVTSDYSLLDNRFSNALRDLHAIVRFKPMGTEKLLATVKALTQQDSLLAATFG